MKHATLSAGRLLYALSAGLALVVTSLNPDNTAAVGAYTLQAGIAAAVAAILPLGFDRALARHRVTSNNADFPRQLVYLRVAEIGLLVVVMALFGVLSGLWMVALACAAFAAVRLIYADLEGLWVASARSETTLGVVIGSNGVITAVGILMGAPFGGSAMVLLSTLGNLLATIALLALGRWQVGDEPLLPHVREAAGFGASSLLAVAYARVDLLILAAVGLSLDAVAIYGILTRLFDALSLIRGSIAQIEMRRLAPMTPALKVMQCMRLALKTAFASIALSVVAIACAAIVLQLPAFATWQPFGAAVFIAAASIPAFMSHLPTSALILSDRRSHLLLVGSVISTALAVAVKLVLIANFGINGAVLAIGLVELISFVVFMTLYRSSIPLKRVATSAALPAVALVLGGWLVVTQQ